MNTVAEIQERHTAIQQLERSLLDLHQIFLDMAVLVEQQVSRAWEGPPAHLPARARVWARVWDAGGLSGRGGPSDGGVPGCPQGDMLNNIEVHIQKAQDYTRKGTEQLQGAKEQQRSMRKWMCIGLIVALCIIIAIVVPVATAWT